jgi:alkylation response protein AidB-like acyl-CoA dehydrogenase
MTDFIEEF